TEASITPIKLISGPEDHQERSVMDDLTAPTIKCAMILRANAQTIAAKPRMKKNGMMGMNAPTAVESADDADDFHGLGNRCSDKPSSLWAIAWTSCSGDSAKRSAIRCASSGLNP